MVFAAAALTLQPEFASAQAPLMETDFEWEMNRPGRTMFRDLTPVGKIELVHMSGQGGLLGKKGKGTGEAIVVNADVAFVPGDSLRYFAAVIQLWEGGTERAFAVLDANELLGLSQALSYMLETAGHIIDTERPESRISRMSKSGLGVNFFQHGKVQRFTVDFPDKDHQLLVRGLEPEQFQSLRDLLDLTMFELRRQGALIEP
jgi:hypothetical protein